MQDDVGGQRHAGCEAEPCPLRKTVSLDVGTLRRLEALGEESLSAAVRVAALEAERARLRRKSFSRKGFGDSENSKIFPLT